MTGIVVGEAQTLLRHAVKARGLDYLLPIATQVSVAEIVTHDVDQIGLGFGKAELAQKEEVGQNEEGESVHDWLLCGALGKVDYLGTRLMVK